MANKKPKTPEAIRIQTRPQDWAAPARAYLFGLHTLTQAERAREITRMSGGRLKYGHHND